MRRLVFLLALALAAAASANTAFGGVGGTDRPFKGAVVGNAIFLPDNPKNCPAPYSITTTGEGVGTASHLGAVTFHTSHCPLADGTVTNTEMVITAANGDELYGSYTGSSGAPDATGYLTGHYTVTFTGGTGRFEGATGTATLNARVLFLGFDVFVWPGSWWWEGTISY